MAHIALVPSPFELVVARHLRLATRLLWQHCGPRHFSDTSKRVFSRIVSLSAYCGGTKCFYDDMISACVC